MKNLVKITILLLNAILLSVNLQACNNDAQKEASSKKQIEGKPAPPPHISFFTPLTYGKFHSIRNNNDTFSTICISYISNNETERKNLLLVSGNYFATNTFSSLDLLLAGYSNELYTTSPPTYDHDSKDLAIADLNDVLDYLDTNHDYFFNAEEYDGLVLPVQTHRLVICDDNYVFGLAIYEPGGKTNAWGISKCMHDPPSPGRTAPGRPRP